MEMRRKDREVRDLQQIYDILRRCDTITLGMNGGIAPYVIPLTFACSMEEGKIAVYFHSAKGGRKWEILHRDPHVSVEAHLYYKVVSEVNEKFGSVTAKYESVTGTGIAALVEDHGEKVAAFRLMMGQYQQSGFPVESCQGMQNCEVFKVVLTEVCGKRNK